ncbi:MAG: hypothetical protein K9L86_04765 [Candidatus Omnitrophica bacterium]|nr:hypothetical protein [Candidatus Omnitrophota bacterium]
MRALLIFVFCLLFTGAEGHCDSFTKDWHWTYRGDIAGQTGGLTLVYDQENVIGELYFDSDYMSIPLSGTLDGRKITLKNEDGIVINASFQDQDDAYGDSKLNREVIAGDISSAEATGHIRLKMDYGSAGDLNSMYAIGGMDDDEMVDNFAQDFKRSVLNRDKEKVSNMVYYPLNTDLGEIKNRDEFLVKFDEIFYPEFLDAFKEANPKNMFSKYTGAMMTSDDNVFWIWFGGDNNKASVISIFSDKEKIEGAKR